MVKLQMAMPLVMVVLTMVAMGLMSLMLVMEMMQLNMAECQDLERCLHIMTWLRRLKPT